MTQPPDQTPEAPSAAPVASKSRRYLIVAAVVVGAVAGLAGVYGMGGFQRNAADASCRPAADLAQRLAPLAKGEVAAVTVAASPLRLPDLTFRDGQGTEKKLSDWRGRTVLLNLWATWCVPCREEMPALDGLQAKLGGPNFEVVTVNIDTRDPAKPQAWLKDVGIKDLAYYADPKGKVFTDLKLIGRAFGMPTTLLVDTQGCEIASLAGPAAWSSNDALKLVTAAQTRS